VKKIKGKRRREKEEGRDEVIRKLTTEYPLYDFKA